jgi:hypothetical protein
LREVKATLCFKTSSEWMSRKAGVLREEHSVVDTLVIRSRLYTDCRENRRGDGPVIATPHRPSLLGRYQDDHRQDQRNDENMFPWLAWKIFLRPSGALCYNDLTSEDRWAEPGPV